MKTHIHHILLTLCLCVFVAFFFSGCQNSLRFAPTEPQKQAAELTHDLAVKVKAEGTAPGSPASEKLCEGTRAAVSYMGRPKTPPNPELYDTTVAQAQADAAQRPDPWDVADNMLELGIGISALLGGVYGAKGVRYLKQAREKSQALQEIIQGNELFMDNTDATAKSNFKQFQKKQSPATKRLVTELKS